MINYPIKFEPILKEKIWGGNKLKNVLHKNTTLNNVGESWEISDVDNSVSVVANGALKGLNLKELIHQYTSDFMGKQNYKTFGNNFPILIKFIDAKEDLSIQVHPDDNVAKKRHNSFGKTEMWYVMQADKDANVIVGFNQKMSQEKYKYHLKQNELKDILHYQEVNEGDSFFINAGKIHAIGSGVLLAEIQQTSDITYRVYDWDRKDTNGNGRELHTDLALDVIDYNNNKDYKTLYERRYNQSSTIVDCNYFTTNFLKVKNSLVRASNTIDSFIVYMCTKGAAEITVDSNTEMIQEGQTVLIPATANQIEIKGANAEFLEVLV